MKKLIVAGNWKMNLNVQESLDLVQSLQKDCQDIKNTTIIISPTYLAIVPVNNLLTSQTNIHLSVQDIHYENNGAFTGKISVNMIDHLNIKYCIVGHSEQRLYFNETNQTVNLKVQKLLEANISPIICIGESLTERNNQQLLSVLTTQISTAFKGILAEKVPETIIAYEPIWAIGTGISATFQEANQAHSIIKTILTDLYNKTIAEKVPILYGGSVKENNSNHLFLQENIDGALIGGASLNATSFANIIKIAENIS